MFTRRLTLIGHAGALEGVGPARRLSMRHGGRTLMAVAVGLGLVLLASLLGEGRDGGRVQEYRMEIGPIVLLEYFDAARGIWVPADDSVSPPVLISSGPATIRIPDN